MRAPAALPTAAATYRGCGPSSPSGPESTTERRSRGDLGFGAGISSIASIGSAVALVVFTLISVGHLRVRGETGARTWALVLAIATTVVVPVTFAFTTLVEEPGTAVALAVILLLGVLPDLGWKRSRPHPLPA